MRTTLVSALYIDILAVVLIFLTLQDKHNTFFLYMYIVRNYQINLHSLRNRTEKLNKGLFFYLFLKLVQINYIFSDNVHIYICTVFILLRISCLIKMVKI